jgi:hypothetical protein
MQADQLGRPQTEDMRHKVGVEQPIEKFAHEIQTRRMPG